MSIQTAARTRKTVTLPYFSIRTISCPEDTDNNRKVYVGYTPAKSIIELPTDENVRDYLLEAEGRKRKRPTQVHKAIKDTILNNPENFAVLNSGITIVARECKVDEKERTLTLERPSIINGSQTQGVIRDYCRNYTDDQPFHVKFEILVIDNEDLIAEISIARNLQNDVMSVSIAGRLGQLDDLEKSLQASKPDKKIQKSETKLSEDYIKTERLLQVITALIPEKLWPDSKDFNKVYAYSMKAKCLKEFRELHDASKNPSNPSHEKAKELYKFYLDIAPQALDLYEKWKCHPMFKGTRLRSIGREGSEISDVPDGIVFPILAAHAAFAEETNGVWKINAPKGFIDSELIGMATTVYKEIAKSNPNTMGKSKSCYAALYQVSSMCKRYAMDKIS